MCSLFTIHECDENRDDYIDCLEKLNVVVENINSRLYLTIVGDLTHILLTFFILFILTFHFA